MKKSLHPLWIYNQKNTDTWKYLDVIIGGDIDKRTAYVRRWVLNPDFKYKHLDKNYEMELSISERKRVQS